MRILVTGAGGFVGGHLIERLLADGHEVVACARRPFEAPGVEATEVFDIRQAARVAEVFDRHRPEGVIHLAAMASVPESWKDPGLAMRVNLLGAMNVLEAAGDARVLLVGSAQVYGPAKGEEAITESHPLEPRSPYAVAKAAAEMMGRLYFLEKRRQVVMTRSFNHIGPGRVSGDVASDLSSRIAGLRRRGERRLEAGRLDAVRDFADVRDVVEAYRLLLEEGEAGEVYNVCSGSGVRISDLLEMLLKIAGLELEVEVIEAGGTRVGDPDVLVGDPSKVRSAVGWGPKIPLKESLEDILAVHGAGVWISGAHET